MIKNKYGITIDCKFFDFVYTKDKGHMCKFDSALHNCFLDCDEKGTCIYNLANKVKNRNGSWVALPKNQKEINETLDDKLRSKLIELYKYDIKGSVWIE